MHTKVHTESRISMDSGLSRLTIGTREMPVKWALRDNHGNWWTGPELNWTL